MITSFGSEKCSFKKCRIPKSKDKYRSIYLVDEEWKCLLRKKIPELERILTEVDKSMVNYGFLKGKNVVQNAMQHIGKKYVLSLDIEDFFDHVTIEHVNFFIKQELIDLCFIDGAPRQGLPTSPIIANIAFAACDKAIIEMLLQLGLDVAYTRYADDLTFSFNDKLLAKKVYYVVCKIVHNFGFKINVKKTSLQAAKNGRFIITGVAVDSKGVHATRKIKKKMRAALHQRNIASYRGLLEWSKCKEPN